MDMKWNVAIFIMGFLMIAFFKVTGIIHWEWFWICSPLWAAAIIYGLEWLVEYTREDF